MPEGKQPCFLHRFHYKQEEEEKALSIKPVRVQAHVHGKSLGKRIWQHRVIYLFILPAVVWFLIFNYYPMYGLLLAFKNYKYNLGILGSPWVGVKWFRKFLLDRSFWQIIRNTLSISVLKLVFGFPMPIILALMLAHQAAQPLRRIGERSAQDARSQRPAHFLHGPAQLFPAHGDPFGYLEGRGLGLDYLSGGAFRH